MPVAVAIILDETNCAETFIYAEMFRSFKPIGDNRFKECWTWSVANVLSYKQMKNYKINYYTMPQASRPVVTCETVT